ncbi:MAG: GLPGLI family protein, partial [Bacteroidota bacterium]
MMKNYFIVIVLLCYALNISSSYCQNNTSGLITYNVSLGDDKLIMENKTLRPFYIQAIKASENLKYELHFKDGESIFKPQKRMSVDGENIDLAKAFVGCDGLIYTNYKEALVLYEKANSKDNVVLKKDDIPNWKLINEKKYIHGYECYKAEAVLKVINEAKSFNFKIIAWYTPQIPLPYGPKGYFGLPGLILELQERNVSFGLSEIKYGTNNTIKIDKPKGKVVSLSDYN